VNDHQAIEVADLRAVLGELLSLWENGPDQAKTPRGRPYTEARVKAVTALAAHTHRLGSAVALMIDHGFALETAPTVRSVLEHGLTTQWIMQYGDDAMYGFVNEAQRQRKAAGATLSKLVEAMKLDEARAVADALGQETLGPKSAADDAARSMQKLSDDFTGGQAYYFMYRTLSQFIHPGPMIAEAYIDSHDLPQIRLTPHPIRRPMNWLYVTCTGVLWAARAADILNKEHPHREILRRHARRLGVPLELKLSEVAWLRREQATMTRARRAHDGQDGT